MSARRHDRYSDFTCRADAAMDDTPETRRVLCRYRYDALDRIAVVDPEAQEAVSRFYQKNRLTVEIQGATRRRVFHGEDRLLAEYKTEGSSVRADLLGTDMQGSVLEAVSGQERQSLAYSPYGHRAQGGPFSGFNGERADPVTGHYLLGKGYRAFNPVLMRFNSPDSLSPCGRGGLNAYAYCQGDPVNRSDPGGHISSPFLARMRMHFKPRSSVTIENLPDEMIGKILERLSFTDVNELGKASTRLNSAIAMQAAWHLKKRWAGGNNPSALSRLNDVVKNEPSHSVSAFMNDHFKTGFEEAVNNVDQIMSNQIQAAKRAEQSFFEEFTGISNASHYEFGEQLAIKRQEHARSPDMLREINRDVGKRTRLTGAKFTSIGRKADMMRLVAEIRTALNSP
ncbi:YD repeat-containing protein [Pseudomonas syringae]|nr:YD repeat-containing protein [Pseudomonas syringae]